VNLQPATGSQAVFSLARAQDAETEAHFAGVPATSSAAVNLQSVVPSLQADPSTVQVANAQEAAVPAVHLQSPLQSDSDFVEQSSQIVKIIKDNKLKISFFDLFLLIYFSFSVIRILNYKIIN